MCCTNWKVFAVMAGIGVVIFAVAPGWDTGAFALGSAVLAGVTKWLGGRLGLDGQCALPARQDSGSAETDRGAHLRLQLQMLDARGVTIRREMAGHQAEAAERK